ncbi:MAG: hypothetical protein ACRDSK_02400 [Actinophytocola sp.]|uniref:hypothetical protein n=1 Tax=Actinophytocola sp. TaxID=1872138 RepID=UPI003D6AF515
MPLPQRIDDLLAAKDGFSRAQLAALDEGDRVEVLRRALDPADPNRIRTIGILAALATTHADALTSLGQAVGGLLSEVDADPFAMAAAVASATSLGPAATPLVEAAASAPDPVVALAAWRALGQVATSDSLDRLAQAAPPPGDVVGDQAAFTLSVIAYRAGVTGFELPILNDTHIIALSDQAELFSINRSATTDADFELLANCSSGDLYLLSPAREATTTIDCGPDHLLVCLDPDIQAGIPLTVRQAPALAGIVLVRDPQEAGFSVRYLILTQPDGIDGAHITLYQPDGQPAYNGHPNEDEIVDGRMSFPLFAVDRPGVAPIALSLDVDGNGLGLAADRVAATEVATDRLTPDEA